MEEAALRRLIMTKPEILQVWSEYAVLKSLFITRKLNGADILDVFKRVTEIRVLEGWGKAGIDEAAKRRFRSAGGQSGQEPLAWLHPRVLLDHPEMARYYLSVASVGRKIGGAEYRNLSRVAEHGLRPQDCDELEVHLASPVTVHSPLVDELVRLNDFITVLLSDEVQVRMFGALAVTSIGATLDGAWKDEIGRLGVIKSLVQIAKALGDLIVAIETRTAGARHKLYVKPGIDASALFSGSLSPRQLVNRLQTLDIPAIDFLTDYEHQEGKVAALWLSNGYRIVVEYNKADICILDPDGVVVAAGEVKANTDPQNSWERWRIGQESLHQFRGKWPSAIRFYVGLMLHEDVVMGQPTRVGIAQALAAGTIHKAMNLHRIEENVEGSFDDFRQWLLKQCDFPAI